MKYEAFHIFESSPPCKAKTEPMDSDISVDLAEQLRAVLIRLTDSCNTLLRLPNRCSFRILMEMKDMDSSDLLVQTSSQWLQPSRQPANADGLSGSLDKTIEMYRLPIRTVVDGSQ